MTVRNWSSKLRDNSEILRKFKTFTRTTAIPLRLIDPQGRVLWQSDFFKPRANFCNVLRRNGFPTRRCQKTHKEAARESMRWGEAIIAKCCYSLMQITSPVMEEGKRVAHIVASPFLLVDPSELQPEELAFFSRGRPGKRGVLEKALSSVPIVKDEEVREAAQDLFRLADHVSEPDLSGLLKVREAQALQGKIADQICNLKNLDREFTPNSLSRLFYEQEKEIISKIRLGDRRGAEEILHQLLAVILVQYLEAIELLKISILELLIILSRAAAEAGAKIEEMLGMRYGFVTELAGIKDQETLCLWVVNVLEKLMDRIYQTRNAKNFQRLKRAFEFIEASSNHPLTVEQIARQVCLSPSRLSHVIKNEMGLTLGEYISKVRVERAKGLLKNKEIPISQVAQEVGFSDQSYFTKVFKKVDGWTPKAYRQNASKATGSVTSAKTFE